MRRFALTSLALITTLATLLSTAVAAQAVVVNDRGQEYGVALVPGTESNLATAGVTAVTTAGCTDPWLSPDLGGPSLPAGALCWQGGSKSNGNAILHRNETFDLTWDPLRRYWAGTRGYVEQFLRDVADGSGSLSSPYAVTTQYRDANGKAGNASLYGGGCIDYGALQGDFTCQFSHAVVTGAGQDYPAGSCPSGSTPCVLSDGDIQTEVKWMIGQMGLSGRLQPGYKPLLVVLIPSGVNVCLDSADKLCSVGTTGASAEFCSYHSHLTVGSDQYAYVVQPWTAFTACDETGLPEPVPVAVDAARRMVNPLSQGEIDAVVNPWLNGWYASNGSEMSDNTCVPDGFLVDQVKVGKSSQNPYVLQPEFNNAGVIEYDPNAPACADGVTLAPSFVTPSPIDAGEVVAFDGSSTASSLIVASTYPWTSTDGYHWNFGDGTSADGPSVTHSFAKAGYYRVRLTVTDRGGNVSTLAKTVEVLQSNGQPPSSNSGGGHHSSSGFKVHLQLLPQSLKQVLGSGMQVRVSSNEKADGFASLVISKAAAQRAHIHGNRTSFGVVVGRGTVSGIKDGTVSLRVRLSSSTASKLAHMGYLSLTLRLALVDKSGTHVTAQVTGRY